jgi:uncharacterized membrane protein YraQ (UPF0718 family)
MTHFPIVASLFKVGVGIGPLVSYLTAWSLLGLQRIIMWEIPFLGPKVVAVRFAVSFFFPFLAGLVLRDCLGKTSRLSETVSQTSSRYGGAGVAFSSLFHQSACTTAQIAALC